MITVCVSDENNEPVIGMRITQSDGNTTQTDEFGVSEIVMPADSDCVTIALSHDLFLDKSIKIYQDEDTVPVRMIEKTAYPIGKHHVQVVHNFDKLGLAKLVVVIVPASHLALNLYCYLLEFPVKMGMQLPLLHLLMQLLHRFPADSRKKVCEALALLSIP